MRLALTLLAPAPRLVPVVHSTGEEVCVQNRDDCGGQVAQHGVVQYIQEVQELHGQREG